LQALAADIDGRIESLRKKFGEIGDTRLTVMAALMWPTNWPRLRASCAGRGGDYRLAGRAVVSSDRAKAASDAVVGAFNSAAERLEGITKKLNATLGNGVGMG